MATLTSVKVVGLHKVDPSLELFEKTLEWLYGEEGKDNAEAQQATRDHFANLYLLEFEIAPAGSEMDWIKITQEQPHQPRENWQVPWDERALNDAMTRWACFLHCLDPRRPLLTPFGPVKLPAVTPVPPHLQHIEYEAP